jgi:putative ABC transport system permease protein
MNLLRLITWPYLRKHRLRSVLTTAGITLGVALLVGMHTADDSVLRAFNDTMDRISGKAQLQVTAGDAGFAEEVLDRVQSVPEVRAAAPVIESEVDTGRKGEARLLVVAVDMTGDRSLRDYDFDSADEDVIDDPLVFLAQPDSLILTRQFADRTGFRTGSRILLDTMDGPRQFTVRGILKAGGMAKAYGGNLAVMDIYAAQKVFGRGRRFDRIDIALREDVPLDRGQAAVRRAVGPGIEVDPPSGRTRDFQSLLGVYNLAIKVSSAFALLIGMFIIYNSFSIAVTQRRSEIGILRALGATRGQIRTLFLFESAVAGAIGSAIGIGLGIAFAHSMTGMTGQLMTVMFGVRQNAQEAVLDPRLLAVAFALGIATSMLAAFIPARSAAAVEPVQALQKGKYQVLGSGESRFRRWAAAGCIAGALACLGFSQNREIFFAGLAMYIFSVLLLIPFLCQAMVRLLRIPLRWLRPVEGSLAADSLLQAPRRTSATVAALVLSLALVVGQGGAAAGSWAAIGEWVDDVMNPDLFVATDRNFGIRNFHFPASMGAELERVPGIAEVQAVRSVRVQYQGLPMMVVGAEEAKVSRRIRSHVIAGDRETMYRLCAEGKGAIIAENLAALARLRLGDHMSIPTPTGILDLPVVGIVRDLSNQLGTVFIDLSAFARAFQDDSVDIFRIYLKPGAAPEEVRRRIVESLGPQKHLFVMLNRDARAFIDDLMNQWFGMTYLQVLVAVAVAVLGIVNTLTVSITDRRRELGVLRAVGGLRAQIRHTIWMEAFTIGVIGLVLGLAAGAIYLYYALQVIQVDLTGILLPYRFPLGLAAILLPVIVAAAWASAILPAEKAVRTSLVEALEYE